MSHLRSQMNKFEQVSSDDPARQNDGHYWKHYLPATSLAGSNKIFIEMEKLCFLYYHFLKYL